MTATEPRWTVGPADEDGLHTLRLPGGFPAITVSADEADLFRSALNNEYARRALPDGVELHRDGTMWALGRNIPDGWLWRQTGGLWAVAVVRVLGDWYEVRPPQEPPTVRVPWWEALGRVSAHNGEPITAAEYDPHADVVLRCGSGPSWYTDADGTVEVLR